MDNIFDVVKKANKKPFEGFVRESKIESARQNRLSDMSKRGFVFKQYPSLKDSFDEIEELRKKPNKEDYENEALDTIKKKRYASFDSFINAMEDNNPSFEEAKELIENIMLNMSSVVNVGGGLKNDKIKITEDKRGVFDFGLASLGLYRPIEFYSEELYLDILNDKIVSPFKFLDVQDGVVSADLVTKDIVSGVNYFSYTYLNKNYNLERRQKGATKVFNTFPSECVLKANSDNIILTYRSDNKTKVFNGSGNARLKYASSNKKSYLIYDKKSDNVKHVDIFMPINLLGVNDATRALMFLPAYLIAGALEQYGVQTRISIMRLGSDRSTHISASIPIKDYGESTKIAFNKAFNLSSTTTNAQEYMAFFKILAENEGIQAPSTQDTSVAFSNVNYDNLSYINDVFTKYKNWAEINKDQPFFNSQVKNSNFQIMLPSIAYNLDSGDLTFKSVLGDLHRVIYTFYFYLDFLSLELMPLQEFIGNIFRRFSEDETFRSVFEIPTETKGIKALIFDYVRELIKLKYITVSGGEYADTIEQMEEKDAKFEEKINSLKEILNSY